MDRRLQLLIQIALKNERSLQGVVSDLEKINRLSKVKVEGQGVRALGDGLKSAAKSADDLLNVVGQIGKDELSRLVKQVTDFNRLGVDAKTQFEALKAAVGLTRKQFEQISAISKQGLGDGIKASAQEVARLSQLLGVSYEAAKRLSGSIKLPSGDIQKAIALLNQLSAAGVPIEEQFLEVQREIGASRSQIEKLYLAIRRAPPPPEPIVPPKEALLTYAQLGAAIGKSSEEAKQLSESLNLPTDQIRKAVGLIQELATADVGIDEQFTALSREIGLSREQFSLLEGVASRTTEEIGKGGKKSTISFANLAGGVFLVQQAIGALVATAQPAYQALIGSNEQLNQQLLKSSATIAATSRVYQGGKLLVDPTETIKTLQGPLKKAIKDVEIATRDLVGVTSEDVNTAFSSVLQNVSQLNGQLNDAATGAQKFATPIEAATALAPGLVATLGTLGLPLEQAADEINNLLKGEIDSTAQLAKSLNISREQIEKWKEQGTLVDQLVQRFNPFVEANAIAARSIGGLSSNIQDIIQVIGRTVGEPLLEPFVRSLEIAYQLLQKNQEAIQQFFERGIGIGVEAGKAVVDAFTPLAKSLLEVASNSGPVALSVLEAIALAIELAATAIGLVAPIIGKVLEVVSGLAATDLGGILIQTTLLSVALAAVATTITGSLIPALFGALPAGLLTSAAAMAKAATTTLLFRGGLLGLAKAAIPAAIKGISALIPAIASLWATLAPVLAPLAVLAAGVAIVVTVRKAKGLEDAQQALDTYLGTTNALADESLNLASKLKALNDVEVAGGKLTEEQTKKRREYSGLAFQTATAINEQIEALKAVKPENEAQANQIQIQIGLLEKRRDLLGKNSEGLRIEGQALEKLGPAYKQLESKIKAANEAIRQEGSGDQQRFTEQIKQLQELTLKQVELGEVSNEVAIARLEGIIKNEKVGYEAQLAASEAIEQLRQKEIEKIKSRTDTEIQLLEARAQGRIAAELAAAEEINKLKKTELDGRAGSNQSAIDREEKEIAAGVGSLTELEKLLNERKALEAERIGLANDSSKRILDIEQQAADQRKAILDNEVAAIELAADKGSKGRVSAAQETSKKLAETLQADTQTTEAAIAEQKRLLSEGSGDDGELKRLEAQLESQRIQQERQTIESAQNITDARIAETERQAVVIEKTEAATALKIAKLKEQGTTSAIALQKKELQATIDKTQAQIKLEEKKLADLRQGPKTDANREAIAQQENAITQLQVQAAGQRTQLREQSEQAELAAIERKGAAIQRSEATTALETARLKEQGTTSAIALQKKELQATIDRTQAQIQIEQDKLATLKKQPQSQENLDAIAQQESAITQLQIQAINSRIQFREQSEQAELAAIERKGLSIEESEAKTALRVAQLRDAGTADQIERDRIELQSASDRAQSQLRIEQDKLALLKAKPPNQDNLDEIQRQETAITQLQAQAIDARLKQEEQAEQAALEILDRKQKDAIALIEESEAERSVILQQRENDLRSRGIAESVIEKDRAAADLQAQKDNLSTRLAAQQEYLARLESLPSPDDPDRARVREEQIRGAKVETARITEQLLQNQEEQQKQLTQLILDDIDKEQQARETASQAVSASLDREQQLLAARGGLAESIVRVEEARLRNQASATDSAVERANIELKIAQLQQRSLLQRQEAERQSLQFTQRRALLENEIAIASAKAELAKARARGATQEELSALQQVLDITSSLGGTIKQTQELERQTLANNQEADRIGAQGAVESAAKAIGEAVKSEVEKANQAKKSQSESQPQGSGEENQAAAGNGTTEVRRGGVVQRYTVSGKGGDGRGARASAPAPSATPGAAAAAASDQSQGQTLPGLAEATESLRSLLQEVEGHSESIDQNVAELLGQAGANNQVLVEALGTSTGSVRSLAGAARQAAARLSSIPAIKARKDGGAVERGGVYSIAELMPELFVTKGGAQLITQPQIFQANQDGHVIDGMTTRRMLQRTQSPIYSGSAPSHSTGNDALLFEMRQLRNTVQGRPPVQVGGDTINISPNDLPRAMDYQAMRQRAAIRSGGLG